MLQTRRTLQFKGSVASLTRFIAHSENQMAAWILFDEKTLENCIFILGDNVVN
jgi:hypothetical protein